MNPSSFYRIFCLLLLVLVNFVLCHRRISNRQRQPNYSSPKNKFHGLNENNSSNRMDGGWTSIPSRSHQRSRQRYEFPDPSARKPPESSGSSHDESFVVFKPRVSKISRFNSRDTHSNPRSHIANPSQPTRSHRFNEPTPQGSVPQANNLIDLDIQSIDHPDLFKVSYKDNKIIFTAVKPNLFKIVRRGGETLWRPQSNQFPYKVVCKRENGKNVVKTFFPEDKNSLTDFNSDLTSVKARLPQPHWAHSQPPVPGHSHLPAHSNVESESQPTHAQESSAYTPNSLNHMYYMPTHPLNSHSFLNDPQGSLSEERVRLPQPTFHSADALKHSHVVISDSTDSDSKYSRSFTLKPVKPKSESTDANFKSADQVESKIKPHPQPTDSNNSPHPQPTDSNNSPHPQPTDANNNQKSQPVDAKTDQSDSAESTDANINLKSVSVESKIKPHSGPSEPKPNSQSILLSSSSESGPESKPLDARAASEPNKQKSKPQGSAESKNSIDVEIPSLGNITIIDGAQPQSQDLSARKRSRRRKKLIEGKHYINIEFSSSPNSASDLSASDEDLFSTLDVSSFPTGWHFNESEDSAASATPARPKRIRIADSQSKSRPQPDSNISIPYSETDSDSEIEVEERAQDRKAASATQPPEPVSPTGSSSEPASAGHSQPQQASESQPKPMPVSSTSIAFSDSDSASPTDPDAAYQSIPLSKPKQPTVGSSISISASDSEAESNLNKVPHPDADSSSTQAANPPNVPSSQPESVSQSEALSTSEPLSHPDLVPQQIHISDSPSVIQPQPVLNPESVSTSQPGLDSVPISQPDHVIQPEHVTQPEHVLKPVSDPHINQSASIPYSESESELDANSQTKPPFIPPFDPVSFINNMFDSSAFTIKDTPVRNSDSTLPSGTQPVGVGPSFNDPNLPGSSYDDHDHIPAEGDYDEEYDDEYEEDEYEDEGEEEGVDQAGVKRRSKKKNRISLHKADTGDGDFNVDIDPKNAEKVVLTVATNSTVYVLDGSSHVLGVNQTQSPEQSGSGELLERIKNIEAKLASFEDGTSVFTQPVLDPNGFIPDPYCAYPMGPMEPRDSRPARNPDSYGYSSPEMYDVSTQTFPARTLDRGFQTEEKRNLDRGMQTELVTSNQSMQTESKFTLDQGIQCEPIAEPTVPKPQVQTPPPATPATKPATHPVSAPTATPTPATNNNAAGSQNNQATPNAVNSATNATDIAFVEDGEGSGSGSGDDDSDDDDDDDEEDSGSGSGGDGNENNNDPNTTDANANANETKSSVATDNVDIPDASADKDDDDNDFIVILGNATQTTKSSATNSATSGKSSSGSEANESSNNSSTLPSSSSTSSNSNSQSTAGTSTDSAANSDKLDDSHFIRMFSGDSSTQTELGSSSVKFRRESTRFFYSFKSTTTCTYIRFREKRIWGAGEHSFSSPRSVSFNEKTNQVTITNDEKRLNFAMDSNGDWNFVSESILESHLKIFVQDPKDSRQTVQLGTSIFKPFEHNNHLLYDFNFEEYNCVEVKYKDNQVWKYNPEKSTVFPKFISWHESFTFVVMRFMPDVFMVYRKVGSESRLRFMTLKTTSLLDQNKVKLYTKDSDNNLKELEPDKYEFKDVGFAFEYLFKEDVNCHQLKYDNNVIYNFKEQYDNGKFPLSLYLFSNTAAHIVFAKCSYHLPAETQKGGSKDVQLNIKDDKDTNHYKYEKKDKVVTYTAINGFRFGSVISQKSGGCCSRDTDPVNVWTVVDENDLATKVVVNGKGEQTKSVSMHLFSGTVVNYKKGEDGVWKYAGLGKPAGAKTSPASSGSSGAPRLAGSSTHSSGASGAKAIGSGAPLALTSGTGQTGTAASRTNSN